MKIKIHTVGGGGIGGITCTGVKGIFSRHINTSPGIKSSYILIFEQDNSEISVTKWKKGFRNRQKRDLISKLKRENDEIG